MLSDVGITSPRHVLGDPLCQVLNITDGIATVKCGRHQFTVPAGERLLIVFCLCLCWSVIWKIKIISKFLFINL